AGRGERRARRQEGLGGDRVLRHRPHVLERREVALGGKGGLPGGQALAQSESRRLERLVEGPLLPVRELGADRRRKRTIRGVARIFERLGPGQGWDGEQCARQAEQPAGGGMGKPSEHRKNLLQRKFAARILRPCPTGGLETPSRVAIWPLPGRRGRLRPSRTSDRQRLASGGTR